MSAFTRATLAAALVVLVAGLTTGAYRVGAQSRSDVAGLGPEFSALAQAYRRVVTDAVEVPEDDALAEGAVEGLLASLGDPYAAYYTEAEFSSFSQSLKGEISGVGLVLEERSDGAVVVVSVIDGSPAARAGVPPGARITAVDGRNVEGLDLPAIVALVKGEEGTTVTMSFAGPDGDGADAPGGIRTFELERERIEVPNIEQRLEPDGAGYVKLLQFPDRSGEELRAAVDELVAQGATGIVLDLRGNTGGLLNEAVAVASVFIEDGPVVSVQERESDVEVREATGDALEDLPLVVLVDGGSASASEIVAGAVADLDRGQVVGQPTFGKGTVQTVEALPAGGGVKFTTAQYLTPSGESIEEVGVIPDRIVEDPQQQLAAARDVLRQLVAASKSQSGS